MALDDQVELANRGAREFASSHPKAIHARYDRHAGRVVIDLDSKLEIAFSPHDAQGLEDAHPDQLEPIEISPSGFGIYFPKLDADVYLPALLEGFLGSKKWVAARMGAAGGRAKSKAKSAAAKMNGRMGGRPRKNNPARRVAERELTAGKS
jgi:hypothetical protein